MADLYGDRAAVCVGGGIPGAHAETHKPQSGSDKLSVGVPSTIGSANAEGSADSFVRQDHIHAHGDQAGGSLHAAAIAGGANGFLTGADARRLADLWAATDKVLWVSGSGNDGTAEVDNIGRPFLTPQAAMTAASSGETIVCLPGSFAMPTTWKDGVSIKALIPRKTTFTFALGATGSVVSVAENAIYDGIAFIGTIASGFTATLLDFGSGTAHLTSKVVNCLGVVTGAGDTILADSSSIAGLSTEAQKCIVGCDLFGVSAGAGIGLKGGGLAANNRVWVKDTVFSITGTGGKAVSVGGEICSEGCTWIGAIAYFNPAPLASNVFRYDQQTKRTGAISGGGTFARLYSTFDNALASGTVYVDPTIGSTAIGIINDRSRPFPTPQDAIDAASAGMIVECAPADYSGQTIVHKPGVSVRGMDRKKCILSNTATSTTLVTMATEMVMERFQVKPSPASGTSTGVAFTGTSNETGVLRCCDIIGGGAGTTNGVDLSGTTNANAIPAACIDDCTISVNGVDIVPHAANANYIKNFGFYDQLDKSGVLRRSVRYSPTLTRRVGYQKGGNVSMFCLKIDDGATTKVTRGPVIGRGYVDGATNETTWEMQFDQNHISDGAVTLKLVWYGTVAGTGTAVRWQASYTSTANGEVVAAAAEVVAGITHTFQGTVAAFVQQETYLVIPAAHADNYQNLSLKIERLGADALDTFTGTCVLRNVRIVSAT